jgi:hypothetical protein
MICRRNPGPPSEWRLSHHSLQRTVRAHVYQCQTGVIACCLSKRWPRPRYNREADSVTLCKGILGRPPIHDLVQHESMPGPGPRLIFLAVAISAGGLAGVTGSLVNGEFSLTGLSRQSATVAPVFAWLRPAAGSAGRRPGRQGLRGEGYGRPV